MSHLIEPPFNEEDQLNDSTETVLATHCGIGNTPSDWHERFATDLKTKLLDEMYDYLWLVAKKDGKHVDSLHEHLIKKRVITIAEDPRLHLVWLYDTLYLKPIPDYLLNHTIWSNYICAKAIHQAQGSQQYNYAAALGFLRSYGLLIRYPSDFIIAKQANLVPDVDFGKFQKFIQPFRDISDDQVARRYHFGQFRLTRLNIAIRILRLFSTKRVFPWSYQQQYWQTGQYLQNFGALVAFIFVILSLILTSMQVALAALGPDTWMNFVQLCRNFSVTVIAFAVFPILLAILIILGILTSQGLFALGEKRKERRLQKGLQTQP
ncbi:hypothetical protein F4821DRAFT_231540 [Hypoxylon rubiginosum]|uniref:Uncharacterized protein n=1 Tax=Hypoxylon rubiginosum TaxID=110542 RepID=A0ACC0D9U8_9PEZI|nr:hypothetical protein F4821DRAFT_231540 [Hypoxylon rubiginosum]